MSFSGTVSKASHEEGLLIAFEGRAPRLGATIRVVGGKTLGRVETVIGSVDNPLIHLHPLPNSVDARSAIGSPVEIAPSGRVNRGRQDRRSGESKFRRGRDSRPGSRRGNDQRGRDRKFGEDWRSSMKPGDWRCPKCKNHNYANKKVCNRTGCEEPKPRGGGGRDRDSRGYRSSNSGGFRDSNMKPGDWRCPKCKNHNYANKKVCNRTGCEESKPRGGGGRDRDSRGHRSSNSDGFRDSNMKPGDWNCPKCNNHNYARRDVCNRCDTRKPVPGRGSKTTPRRARRPDTRMNWKGKGPSKGRRNTPARGGRGR